MAKQFVEGLIAKAPHDQAPEFVKCRLSFHRAELREWLGNRTDEWINVNVKVSQKGAWYAEVDTWKPNGGQPAAPTHKPVHGCPQPDQGGFEDDEHLPF